MMRILAALFLTMVPLAAHAGNACPVAPSPEVEIVTPVVEVSLKAVPDVVAYAPFPKAMETSMGPGWTINGLTVVRPLVKSQLITADVKVGSTTCVWVTKAVVSFGFFEPAAMYVSNKYVPGTCEFEAIRGHEHQHVGIHLNTRLRHVPQMRARVQKALEGMGAVAGADQTSALRTLQAGLSGAVDDGLRSFQAETGQLNAMIDTTDSYLRLQSSCSNW